MFFNQNHADASSFGV